MRWHPNSTADVRINFLNANDIKKCDALLSDHWMYLKSISRRNYIIPSSQYDSVLVAIRLSGLNYMVVREPMRGSGYGNQETKRTIEDCD